MAVEKVKVFARMYQIYYVLAYIMISRQPTNNLVYHSNQRVRYIKGLAHVKVRYAGLAAPDLEIRRSSGAVTLWATNSTTKGHAPLRPRT